MEEKPLRSRRDPRNGIKINDQDLLIKLREVSLARGERSGVDTVAALIRREHEKLGLQGVRRRA